MRAVIARHARGGFEPVAGIAIAQARAAARASCQMSSGREIRPSSPEASQRYLKKIGELLRVGSVSKHGNADT